MFFFLNEGGFDFDTQNLFFLRHLIFLVDKHSFDVFN